MEAAIEYKNESIQSRQNLLRASFQNLSHSEANVLEKLICLSPVEIRAVLFRYFNKVCFSGTEGFLISRDQDGYAAHIYEDFTVLNVVIWNLCAYPSIVGLNSSEVLKIEGLLERRMLFEIVLKSKEFNPNILQALLVGCFLNLVVPT